MDRMDGIVRQCEVYKVHIVLWGERESASRELEELEIEEKTYALIY